MNNNFFTHLSKDIFFKKLNCNEKKIYNLLKKIIKFKFKNNLKKKINEFDKFNSLYLNFLIQGNERKRNIKKHSENFFKKYNYIKFIDNLIFYYISYYHMFCVQKFFIDSYLPKINIKTKILEVGTGHGLQIDILKKLKKDVSLSIIENNSLIINNLKKNYKDINLIKYDIQNQPFFKEKFNYLIVINVFESLQNFKKSIQNLNFILHKNSLCFFNFPINLISPDHKIIWNNHNIIDKILSKKFITIKKKKFYFNNNPKTKKYNYCLILKKK